LLSCVFLLKDIKVKEEKNKRLPWILVKFALFILIAGGIHLDYSSPARDKEYKEYEKLLPVISSKNITMLICHKSLQYYYQYRIGKDKDVFAFEPEKHWDKKRIWRIVCGATPEELFFYKPDYCVWDSRYIELFPNSYYALIREDCYFDLRAAVKEEQNPELYNLLWKNKINPSEPRPAFLYKKHKSETDFEFPAEI